MFSVGQHFILYTYVWVSMVSLADCFLFSRKLRKLRRFFILVLIYLTRSFFEWEAMGLGAGRYEIVVRKLVGEMYRALTITVLTVFLEGVWKIWGAVSNLSNLSFL